MTLREISAGEVTFENVRELPKQRRAQEEADREESAPAETEEDQV